MKYDHANNESIRDRNERRMETLRNAQLTAPAGLMPVLSRRVHRLLAENSFLISVAVLIRDGAQG